MEYDKNWRVIAILLKKFPVIYELKITVKVLAYRFVSSFSIKRRT